VLTDSAGRPPRQAGGQAFWWRLTDNAFRRLGWFLIPVVAMMLLGFSQASKTVDMYQAGGTFTASRNPFIPDQPVSGVSLQNWESAAAGTSRVINEQLRTNSFLQLVANRAGLSEAVESGLLNLGLIRSSVWAAADGESILSVNARWDDPTVAFELVKATMTEFQELVKTNAASDSTEAEEFWTTRLESLQKERETAQTALTTYISSLPPLEDGEDRNAEQTIRLGELTTELDSILSRINDAEAEIDRAQLAHTQQSSEASRMVRVIDEPQLPGAPQSTLMHRMTLVASFVMLGLVISIAALLITTVLDHTVASSADLLAIGGISLVATVPPVRFGAGTAPKRTLLRRRRRREHAGVHG
jgi:hypothetical protein